MQLVIIFFGCTKLFCCCFLRTLGGREILFSFSLGRFLLSDGFGIICSFLCRVFHHLLILFLR